MGLAILLDVEHGTLSRGTDEFRQVAADGDASLPTFG
jgi:hypothetical protein